jgi:hypothetical protein
MRVSFPCHFADVGLADAKLLREIALRGTRPIVKARLPDQELD